MADILIVEDETAINELVRRNLELVGHRCVSVYDGEEAIRRLQEGQFDLMLLDIMLPGADGFEVYQTAEHVPTIFLTAKGGLSDRVRGLRMGADDYIVKPFEMLELLARVEAVLRRTRKSGTDFVFYGVRIDFESRTIEKDGQETDCTPKEYELLETLVKNRNIPCPGSGSWIWSGAMIMKGISGPWTSISRSCARSWGWRSASKPYISWDTGWRLNK